MSKTHFHLISDSTGGTLTSLFRACLAQFDGVDAAQHFWPLVRSEEQLDVAMRGVLQRPGPVLYTLVDEALSEILENACAEAGVPCLSVLHPLMSLMSERFGRDILHKPGLQHRMDAEYFARVEAIDYTLRQNNALPSAEALKKADVVIVGVSRTSKTPTCVYLSGQGIKAASVSLIPGAAPDERLFSVPGPMFVGLTITPERLIEIRRTRLRDEGKTQDDTYADYLDFGKVEEELLAARRLYVDKGWDIVDVTRRSVEEAAAEILALRERRLEKAGAA